VGGACGTYDREVRWIQVGGKPEGKRPLGRPRGRWENNIKIGHQEIAWWGGRVWTGLIWLRLEMRGGLL